MDLKINKNLMERNHTPEKRKNGDIQFIVIHYVGALGDAKENTEYYASTDVDASADFWVGFSGDIWQGNDYRNYYSWHSGGPLQGSEGHAYYGICTNQNSVAIEMCVKKRSTETMNATDWDWYFTDETVINAAKLTAYLMEDLNVDIDHVIRHYDVVGKICPNPFVYNNGKVTWSQFKEMAEGYKETGNSPNPSGRKQNSDGSYTVKKGDTLWAIAKDFGTTVEQLKDWNNLTSDNILIGTVLQFRYWVGEAVKDEVPVRVEPRKGAENIKAYPILNKGNLVDVIEITKSPVGKRWYEVRIAEKYQGYVYGKNLKKQ